MRKSTSALVTNIDYNDTWQLAIGGLLRSVKIGDWVLMITARRHHQDQVTSLYGFRLERIEIKELGQGYCCAVGSKD